MHLSHSAAPSTPPLPETRPAASEVDRCAVTGTHDSGDLLENLLDELSAGLGVLVDLETHHREDQRKLVMLYTLERKAKAASQLYAFEHEPPAATAAPHRESAPSGEYRGGGTATDALRDIFDDLETLDIALRSKEDEHEDEDIGRLRGTFSRVTLRLRHTIHTMEAAARKAAIS
jgi:hypothetical protein